MAPETAFERAVRARDADAITAALAPDVRFRSPVVYRPYEGREAVSLVLRAVTEVFGEFEYVQRLEAGDGSIALIFRAKVGDRELDGLDLLRIDDEGDAVRGRITPTVEYADLADSDLAIEAVTEDLGQKLEVWREMDGIVKPDAVFATNTSSLPVIDQAVATGRPEQFLGMHFFNPPQVMPLLEVVQTVTTGADALKTGFAVGEKLGKTCVHARDKTGFIVNRLLVPYMLDAIRAHEEGVGAIDQIDVAMKAGANHPMGPLTLADFVGLDTLAAIADVMFDEYRERRFAAPPTLRRMVAAGMYGRKSGKGFYDYSGDKPAPMELGL